MIIFNYREKRSVEYNVFKIVALKVKKRLWFIMTGMSHLAYSFFMHLSLFDSFRFLLFRWYLSHVTHSTLYLCLDLSRNTKLERLERNEEWVSISICLHLRQISSLISHHTHGSSTKGEGRITWRRCYWSR